jgi:hypothetical protein
MYIDRLPTHVIYQFQRTVSKFLHLFPLGTKASGRYQLPIAAFNGQDGEAFIEM